GEEVEQEEEEEEEEEERKSLKLIEDTGKVLAKLLFHGTQLVTDVRVGADLRESRRREKEGEDKLRRLEKLEAEAKHGTEKLEEINSKWALAKDMKIPQELWELLEQQQDQCELLLLEKNRLIQELRQELKAKDEQYEQALKEQSGEIHVLLERMEEQTRNMLKTYRHHLRQIEKTFEEERREMLDNNRKRWNEAIQAHNEQELEFLREQMGKAAQFEQQLNELQDESVESYDSMKFQLEMDVQYLEKKLQQMKGIYHLNQVKLEYNLEVLRQLDVENSTLRSLQKRKINRFQSTLSLLKVKMAKQEKKFQEEKQSLESELERVTGQFQETQSRMRHLARSRAEKFRQVWIVNEEEAKGLIREALDADRIIHVQQLGTPWEEPHFWFMDNVGPLGGRQEKKDAMQVAAQLLEDFPIHGYSRLSHINHFPPAIPSAPGKFPSLPSPSQGPLTEFLLFQTLRIEDEDELRQLLDFFLAYEFGEEIDSEGLFSFPRISSPSQGFSSIPKICSPSQGLFLHPKDFFSIPKISSPSQRFLLHSWQFFSIPGNFSPSQGFSLHPKALFSIPRDDGPPKEILDIRDNSKDRKYWEALTHIIPERTLKLWDALGAALLEYHKVLTRRAELLSEATILQKQNSELGILLEDYLESTPGR
uniref:Dynein regulatory complex protein 1 n=1 Tax=Corvus moneduloides TaxID=1196302 RepID=A0A8C3DR88_CORMO